MSKTRDNILQASRLLFNTHGYDLVTIRMIAQKLNMSSGNLNYHFQKKEDILETLYFDMVYHFDKRIDDLSKNNFTLPFILSEIERSMHIMFDYRFFWTDLHHLINSNKKIKSHFIMAYQKRTQGSLFMFSKLEEDGLMQKLEEEWVPQFLTDSMIQYSNTWIYTMNIYREDLIQKSDIEGKSKDLLRILYPYLTLEGKLKFKDAIK